MSSIHQEVGRFRAWATGLGDEHRSGEWEIDYPDWNDLYAAAVHAIALLDINRLDPSLDRDLLYALARDNETGYIAEHLATYPGKFLYLSDRSLEIGEPDAKWQLAAGIGKLALEIQEAEVLLQRFFYDEDEYVRRRALISLGELQSPLTDQLATEAWISGHQYQRMATLGALRDRGSPMLEDYLKRADEDGREHLVGLANRIRSGETTE